MDANLGQRQQKNVGSQRWYNAIVGKECDMDGVRTKYRTNESREKDSLLVPVV